MATWMDPPKRVIINILHCCPLLSLYQYVQQEFTPRSFIFYLFYFLFEASHIVCTNIASILIYLALHINAEKIVFMVINLDRDRESDISSEIQVLSNCIKM